MDVSLSGLRVLREIAELGTFTAAAASLGFTQPAISRQVAALERAAGLRLVERRPGGARLTPAGLTMLRHARVVLDELAEAERELSGPHPPRRAVRLGVYVSAGAALLPSVLRALARDHPDVAVITREGTSPALVRSVRAGTLDLAVVTSRPPHRAPDTELPRLRVETVADAGLVLAVPGTGRFAGRTEVHVDELADVDWIASPSSGAEPLLGVWPGLPGRPRIAHSARDWLTKLLLVAGGHGVTTVSPNMAGVLPDGVALLRVTGAPAEQRRTSVVRLPGTTSSAVAVVVQAVHAGVRH